MFTFMFMNDETMFMFLKRHYVLFLLSPSAMIMVAAPSSAGILFSLPSAPFVEVELTKWKAAEDWETRKELVRGRK